MILEMIALIVASLLLPPNPNDKIIAQSKTHILQAIKRGKKTGPAAMFMMDTNDKWTKMKTDTDNLDKDQVWRDDIAEVADVFKEKGHVFLVVFTLSSESEDWQTSGGCLYRPDGSLEICDQTYAAFAPENGAVHTVDVLNAHGASTAHALYVQDIDGKKKIVGAKAQALVRRAKDTEIKLSEVKTVKSLGFYNLLPK